MLEIREMGGWVGGWGVVVVIRIAIQAFIWPIGEEEMWLEGIKHYLDGRLSTTAAAKPPAGRHEEQINENRALSTLSIWAITALPPQHSIQSNYC